MKEDQFSLNKKKMFFESELNNLKDKNYIEVSQYNEISKAYNSYYENEIKTLQQDSDLAIKETVKVQKPKPTPKPQPVLSQEQIRERNITWTLILGVIFLLISGLFLATSNWGNMNNTLKITSITLVSLLFFGISIFSEKILKIKKTSFAFLTLSSLFVPIIFISIGYFELFGDYLSLIGDGKYILGLISATICLILYFKISQKYHHRLFIWLTYLCSSLTISFLLKSINLPIDAFYLGVMSYNAALLFVYHKYKDKFQLFTKELPQYAQLNLIITTILMLFFFNNIVFYSFNVILTSILYISMIYIYQRKEYHFVFSALIVYGIYQLVENTPLVHLDVIMLSLVSFIFIGFQFYYKNQLYLQKMFRYTSAIIAFCAFIFVSVKGIALNIDNPSVLLFVAYLIISLNYLFLSNINKNALFSYLSPIFMVVAGYELWSLADSNFSIGNATLYMYIIGLIMYVGLYLLNKYKHLQSIKYSSFFISNAVILFTTLFSFTLGEWENVIFMTFIYGVINYFTYKKHPLILIKKISLPLIPIFWIISLLSIYPVFLDYLVNYENNFGISFHIGLSSLILLGISYLWKYLQEQEISFYTFVVSVVFYSLGILSLFDSSNHILTSLLLLIGIGIYLLLVYRTNIKSFSIAVSITNVFFFLSFNNYFDNITAIILNSLLSCLFIIIIQHFIPFKLKELKLYYFWTANAFLPIVCLIAIAINLFDNLNPNLLIIGLIIYFYGTLKSLQEWAKKLFLYCLMSLSIIWILLNMVYMDLNFIGYNLFISLILFMAIWFIVPLVWKRRMDWYLIPLSIFSTLSVLAVQSNYVSLIVTIISTLVTLYLLFCRKWQMFNWIPLLLPIIKLLTFSYFIDNEYIMIALFAITFLLLKEVGQRFYSNIYSLKDKIITIDWYSTFSVLYLLSMYSNINSNSPLWMQLIPPILWIYLLYSQINRVSNMFISKLIKTFTIISCIIPYYIILNNISIPNLIQTECYTLPWIALTILLSKKTWSNYPNLMKNIQLFVLLLIASILVIDAQISHTLNDAILIGVLSLSSLIGGMHYKIKSFFLVGSSVLLLNLFIQTKPYWGNMPWWSYLLISGFILIGFASFYEWQKQKKDHKGQTLIQSKKKELINKFKEWN